MNKPKRMCHQPSRQHHDDGLGHDLPKLLGRRSFLRVLGGFGVLMASVPARAMACTILPWETAGPYPADGSNRKNWRIVNVLEQAGVIRSDLRQSFGAYSGAADGVVLDLELCLQDAGCKPLSGYALYVWACDQMGRYSLYDLPDQNYLRGVGVSDENGIIRFKTIFPGCYDGRWPHIHFEIFKNVKAAVRGESSLLTAQIAMPAHECKMLYAKDARYVNSAGNFGRISLAEDNVFSDNTPEQIAQQSLKLTGEPSYGYIGKINIPVDLSKDKHQGMGKPPKPRHDKNGYWPW